MSVEHDARMNAVTRLRRSKSGDTIHAKDCARAGNTLPWLWAEGRGLAELLAACNANGLRRCRVCDPLWEDDSRTHRVAVSA